MGRGGGVGCTQAAGVLLAVVGLLLCGVEGMHDEDGGVEVTTSGGDANEEHRSPNAATDPNATAVPFVVGEHGLGRMPRNVPESCLWLISVFSAVVVVAVVYVLAKLARREGRLSELLPVTACASLFIVGLAAWAIAYLGAQRHIHDKVVQLLDTAGIRTQQRISNEAYSALDALRIVQDGFRYGMVDLHTDFPRGPVALMWPWVSMSQLAGSAIFFAGLSGEGNATSPIMKGIAPPRDRATGPRRTVQLILQDSAEPLKFPEFIACNATDRVPANATVCVDYNAAGACGSDADMDAVCQATCAGAVPRYVGSEDQARGHVLSARAPEHCGHVAGTVVPHEIVVVDAVFDVNAAAWLPATDGSAVPYAPLFKAPFDAVSRPWWRNASTPRFTAPYWFAMGGLGVSVSAGVYTAEDAFVGVVGIDYDFMSTRELLSESLPTENSFSFIGDLHHRLLSSSFDRDELGADTGQVPSMEVISISRIPYPGSRIRHAFAAVLAEHGSMAAAYAGPSITHRSDVIIMTSPVTIPVEGDLWLLVMVVPHKDVMGAADEAAVLSLVITIVMSVVMSLLYFVSVSLLLMPLGGLAWRMGLAADMHVEQLDDERISRVAEVAGMQRSFRHLVSNLIEYRSFLPQSVILDDGDSSNDEHDFEDLCESQDGQSAVDDASCARATRLTSPDSRGPHIADDVLTQSSMDWSFSAVDRSHVGDDGSETTKNSSQNQPLTPPSTKGPAGRATRQLTVLTGSATEQAGGADRGGAGGDDPPTTTPNSRKHAPHLTPHLAARAPTRDLGRAESSSSLCESLFVLAIHEKRVSLVHLIVGDLLGKAAARSDFAIPQHGALLQVVLEQARRGKGVVDGFAGDAITVVFNAHKPAGNHKLSAVATALNIHSASAHIAFAVSCGVASGRAHAGNMGCPGMKKFNVIGDVVSRAGLMAALAVEWAVRIVASETLLRDVRGTYETRTLYHVIINERRDIVGEVIAAVDHKNEEWMYQLERAGLSPYRAIDLAVDMIFAGDCRDALDVLQEDHSDAPVIVAHKRALAAWARDMLRGRGPPEPLRLGVVRIEKGAAPYVIGDVGSMGMLSSRISPFGNPLRARNPLGSKSLAALPTAAARQRVVPLSGRVLSSSSMQPPRAGGGGGSGNAPVPHRTIRVDDCGSNCAVPISPVSQSDDVLESPYASNRCSSSQSSHVGTQ